MLRLVAGRVLEVKVVLAVDEELGCGNVHSDLDSAGVAGLLDGGDKEIKTFFVVLDVRCEALDLDTTSLSNLPRRLRWWRPGRTLP